MRRSVVIKTVTLAACLAVLIVLSSCGGGGDSGSDAPNQKPVAKISPATEQFVQVGDSINFTGDSSSDPDGNTPLSYQWTFSGAETSIEQSTDSNAGMVSFTEAGVVTVNLVITDNLGLASDIAVVTINVAVESNQPPSGSISHDNGNGSLGSTGNVTITAGDSVVFASAITDPENDAITYAWAFQGGTPATSNSSDTVTVSYPDTGTFSVSLVVSDGNGNSVTLPETPLRVTVVARLPAFKHLPVLPPTMVDDVATYTLNAEENVNVVVETPEGNWTTPMMRYNDLLLPPVIVAKRGDSIKVNVNNNLLASDEDTTVHWHGFKIPGSQDGGPDFPIPAGESKTYSFTLVQPAASLWFHPHAHGTTATQVYNGLAGAFILTDDITDALETNNELPSGEYDIALLVQDRRFAEDSSATGIRNLVHIPQRGMNVVSGEHILVNGVEMPALEVATRQYRFRLYNASNARTYDFALDNGADFYVVGTDGGLLNTPVLTKSIMLGAGERAEIVVDFRNRLNQQVKLISQATPNNAAVSDVMRFDVNREMTDPVILYSSLPTGAEVNTRLTEDQADVTRDFVMSMGMGAGGVQFLINGKTFDMNRVDETVASGAVEIWNIQNTSVMEHPFHAHAIQWQVLDREIGGVISPASGIDLGWKDTVLVQSGETVRFIGRFDPEVNTGLYMYHCHILEHEDAGMMGTFEVLPQ
ncbi:MAG: multicopper oxidase domain-containing protein [Gammaproteobacteria bacterium]|nr:multicopper oxidase domain-containing protein [Gammaproteobacteria bacterium]